MKARLIVLLVMIVGIGACVGAAMLWVGISSGQRVPSAIDLARSNPPTPPVMAAGELRPKLVVEEEHYDFGAMFTDNTGRHDFLLANAGNQPLLLTQSQAACGCCTCSCTASLPVKNKILPGKSANVRLEWEIKEFTGLFRQSVTLLTNDPDRPQLMLSVAGQLRKRLQVVPSMLVFSRVSVRRPATGEVRLYSYLPEQLKTVAYELFDPSSAEHFEVNWEPLAPDQLGEEADARSGCLLRVTVKPGLPLGEFQQAIVIKTNLKSVPVVTVPVQGTVCSDISVAGRGWDARTGVLTLGTVNTREGAQRTLTVVVRGADDKGVQFELIEIVPEVLKVDLGRTTRLSNGAVAQTLLIQVPAGSPPANHLGGEQGELGRISIKTNHPDAPQLCILVRFAIEESGPLGLGSKSE